MVHFSMNGTAKISGSLTMTFFYQL